MNAIKFMESLDSHSYVRQEGKAKAYLGFNEFF